MLTIGVAARRALCRLARPLPSPGPRCNKVHAGTPDISGTASSAATKCISLVPGLVKHVVTPASTRVRIMAWAPFMAHDGTYIRLVETWDAIRARRNVRAYSDRPIDP